MRESTETECMRLCVRPIIDPPPPRMVLPRGGLEDPGGCGEHDRAEPADRANGDCNSSTTTRTSQPVSELCQAVSGLACLLTSCGDDQASYHLKGQGRVRLYSLLLLLLLPPSPARRPGCPVAATG